MSRKHSACAARKHTTPAASWGRYLLAGPLLLAVLVASGISAQLFATSDAAQSSSIEDADRTLYAHGVRLRPLVEETGGAQTLNIYGPGGQIIAQVAPAGLGGSQKASHLLADHLGSTRAILDADGNAVARYEYAPHGETALAAGAAAAEARYRYTGHPYDEEQGLYETPARGYDPTTGRFLSVDPQRQDASPYVYAGNNPVGFVDPTGGGKYPFYVFTGFEKRIISLLKWRSYAADAVASVFGRDSHHNQHAFSADMFNSSDDLTAHGISSLAESKQSHYVLSDVVDYGRMYLFIGGDRGVDKMERLREGMDALGRYEQGFARETTIINFSGNVKTGKKIKEWFLKAGRDPLLVHAGLETEPIPNGGLQVTKFTSGSVEYKPSEFVAHVHGLEETYKQRQRDKEYRKAWDEFVNWKPGGRESPAPPSNGASPMFNTVHSDPLDQQAMTELLLPEQPMITNLDPYDGD